MVPFFPRAIGATPEDNLNSGHEKLTAEIVTDFETAFVTVNTLDPDTCPRYVGANPQVAGLEVTSCAGAALAVTKPSKRQETAQYRARDRFDFIISVLRWTTNRTVGVNSASG